MRWLRAITTTLLLCACGSDGAPRLTPSIQIDAALCNDITKVVVYVLGPIRTDDVVLTCTNLMRGELAVDDERVVQLGSVTISTNGCTAAEAVLEQVGSGENRIVYVEALEEATLIGRGCTPHVTIPEGGEVGVDVIVFAAN